MSYLVWKLNHAEVRRLCIATSFFESGYPCWSSIKDYLDEHTDIEYENGDDIGTILDELSRIGHVNMMVSLANEVLNNVYEGFPPPRSEIDVRSFFESLFGANNH